MAIRVRALLREWFDPGKYPTAKQFSDLFDSFWHKTEDKISMDKVGGLTDQLNGKYPAADGKRLEERVTRDEENLADYIEQTDEAIDQLREEDAAIRKEFAAADATNLAAAKKYSDDGIAAHNTSETAHADIRALLAKCTGLPTYDPTTYKLSFMTNDGLKVDVDLPIEKMDLRYNSETGSIEWDNGDGSVSSVPVSEFIKEYVGSNGEEIIVSIGEGNVIQASVKGNSIAWEKLALALQEKINAKADKTWVDSESLPVRIAASMGTEIMSELVDVSADANASYINVKRASRGGASGIFTTGLKGQLYFPAATASKAGVMTAADKKKSDGLPTILADVTQFYHSATRTTLNFDLYSFDAETGAWTKSTRTSMLYLATDTACGLLSPEEKKRIGKAITEIPDALKLPFRAVSGDVSEITVGVGEEVRILQNVANTLTVTVDGSKYLYPYSGDSILFMNWINTPAIIWKQGPKVATLMGTEAAKDPRGAGLAGDWLVISIHFEPTSGMDGQYNAIVNVASYQNLV